MIMMNVSFESKLLNPHFLSWANVLLPIQFTNHAFKCCMQVAASYYHKMGEKHNSLKHTLM